MEGKKFKNIWLGNNIYLHLKMFSRQKNHDFLNKILIPPMLPFAKIWQFTSPLKFLHIYHQGVVVVMLLIV